MKARERGDQFGAFACETAVMDLWDEGLSIEEIAGRLGKKRSYVGGIIAYMDGGSDNRAIRTAAHVGSQALIAAIRQHHPELVA